MPASAGTENDFQAQSAGAEVHLARSLYINQCSVTDNCLRKVGSGLAEQGTAWYSSNTRRQEI